MKTPTLATQSKAHGSDDFNSSVTYDVQTGVVKRTFWSEITLLTAFSISDVQHTERDL